MNAGDRVLITIPQGRGTGSCIRIWRREDNPQRVVRNGGEGVSWTNCACTLLDQFPAADQVALMCTPWPAPVLFFIHINGRWFDTHGVAPKIEVLEDSAPPDLRQPIARPAAKPDAQSQRNNL